MFCKVSASPNESFTCLLVPCSLQKFICFTMPTADSTPCPAEGEDPYSMEDIPQNLNYSLKMKDGIVNVYDTAEDLSQDKPHCLPYPDMETFTIDMAHVLAMIGDGPT